MIEPSAQRSTPRRSRRRNQQHEEGAHRLGGLPESRRATQAHNMDNIFSKFEECPGQDDDGQCAVEREGWLCRDMAESLIADVMADSTMPHGWSREQVAAFINAHGMWTCSIDSILESIGHESWWAA